MQPSAESESAVLLIHSSGMSKRQWRKLGALLGRGDGGSGRHHVTAPDLLGSGDNPAWPGERSFHFHDDVEVLEATLRALPAPAHVVGHSYGGLLALQLALRAPARVRSLTLYDPVAFGVLHDAGDVAGLEDLAAAFTRSGAFDAAPTSSEDLARWYEAFVDYWNGPGTWSKLPVEARQSFLRVARKVYFEVSTLLADRTPRSAYTALTMPVLLLTGERTPIAAQRAIAHLLEAMPNARSEIIAGAGHMGPLSHADDVNARIAAFIAAA